MKRYLTPTKLKRLSFLMRFAQLAVLIEIMLSDLFLKNRMIFKRNEEDLKYTTAKLF
jgi:hypothetical protein